jgi:dihydroorotate dehydrogenase
MRPHRLLFALPPERAHALALRIAALAPRSPERSDPRLATRLAGLHLPHPVGLAAGFDKNATALAGLFRLGFAFVEIGTVTPRPQAGNERPRLFRLIEDEALINRMGFNNDGLEAVAARLAGRPPSAGIVGGNIGINKGTVDPAADYLLGIERLGPLVDYLVVNVSSPNTPGLRALQKAETLSALLASILVRRNGLPGPRRPPLFVKIAPDLTTAEEAAIAEVVLTAPADGLVISNTTVARAASLRSPRAGEAGGLSGGPLFDPSTELLRRMKRHVGHRLPLIGVGGIDSPLTAWAKIRAGATAVQIYTGLVYQGPGLVRRIVQELPALLERDGFTTLDQAIGVDA